MLGGVFEIATEQVAQPRLRPFRHAREEVRHGIQLEVFGLQIHDLKLPMLLPGIVVSTSADNFAPIKQMQLMKFDGNTWKLFGEVISGSGS